MARNWFGAGSQTRPLLASEDATLLGLRLLAVLRTFTPLAQAATLYVVANTYNVHVPYETVAVVIAAEIVNAIATWIYVARAPRVSEWELFGHAHLDIVLLAVVLYLTGGTTNPFAPLFLLPMAITAVALPAPMVWLTALTTMLAYWVLRYYHVPLLHPQGETEVYELHETGMLVNYMFTAALLAFFALRMFGALRRRERLLADARDAQMRNDAVVAIGALAAGCAHELGSPLATMAVVTGELRLARADDATLQRDLQVIEDQLAECKRIVGGLAQSADRRRAENAGGARADEFVEAIVARVRALRPNATITTTLDSSTPAPSILAEETLRQAITNLVDNAAQASPDQVEVSAAWSWQDLQVTVRDHGPGFPPPLLKRIGKRVGSTRGDEGMGMGLLLSAATLQRLGGTLELSNASDGGAIAMIRVPLKAILIDKTRKPANGNAQR